MGTTLTAAMVWSEGVSIGHVGDSRAYRLRDGALEQLTHDHSLVAELQRSGQLTAEAAENHPQRSIITRALGPEPDVEVDAHTHTARAGDVYVLCSDGLTGMISDADIEAILRGAGSLEDAAQALVKAANQSGGKDNITVVLFRLADAESDGAPAVSDDTLAGSETIHQGLTADDVQAAVREQERAAAKAPATDAAPPAARGLPTPCAPLARPARPHRCGQPAGGRARGLRRLPRGAPRVLPGHRRRRAGHDLPRRALPAAARRRPVQRAVRLERARAVAGPRPPRAAARPRVAQRGRRRGPGAPARTGHAGHRGATRERADARDARADPGGADRERRLRRGAAGPQRGRAPGRGAGRGQGRNADLRPGVPGPVPVRAPVHPRAAARRRPLPVPAGRHAGGVRAGRDLPDRPGAGPRAGAVVRDRAGGVRGHDRVPARSRGAGALPLHDRRGGHRAAADAARARGSASRSTARS